MFTLKKCQNNIRMQFKCYFNIYSVPDVKTKKKKNVHSSFVLQKIKPLKLDDPPRE